MKYPASSFQAIVISSLLLISCQEKKTEILQVDNPRTEMLVNPEGIDVRNPKLTWEISGENRGIIQTAYWILVASSSEKLSANEGDLWDSGKILSGTSIHVPYEGKSLKSRMICYWKVKVWSQDGESDWSIPAHWSMGLLHEIEWQGIWIGMDRAFPWDDEGMFSRLSARYFRKEFTVDKEVSRATVYISGLGLYELYINGQKTGDQVLSPAPTDYLKNVKYNVFDVTDKIHTGINAAGVILGNGRYFTMRNYKAYKIKNFSYPKMLFQLEVEYSDGSKSIIKSDETWKLTADGPIRSNNEYDGEE